MDFEVGNKQHNRKNIHSKRQPLPYGVPINSTWWLQKNWDVKPEHLAKLLALDDTKSETDNAQRNDSTFKSIHPLGTDQYKPSASCNLAMHKMIHYSPTFESSITASSFTDLVLMRRESFSELFSSNKTTPWWLDVQNPSAAQIKLLCSAFDVHPVTIEDITCREDREKLEMSSNYFFACLRSYHEVQIRGDIEYQPSAVYFLVFEKGILTFSFGNEKHGERVQKRIELLKDYVAINSDWIFYAFADDIVDSFFPLIAKVEKRVTEVEDQVYNNRKDDMKAFLRQVEAGRKATFSLMKLLEGKPSVLLSFEQHHCASKIHSNGPKLQHYISDVQDHVIRLRSSLILSESVLARSQENYITGIMFETMQSRQRVSKFMSRTAVLVIILAFLTMITGVFSVNLAGPSAVPWPPVIFGLVILGILLVALVKKHEYL